MAVTAEKRRQIIEDVNESWNELIEVLQSFDTEGLEQPDVIGIWSLKDLVGHLDTWDRIAIRKISYAEEGRTGSWWKNEEIPFKSIDEFNEADADANRHRPIDDLWSELFATHQELVQRLEVTPVLSRDLIREDTYGHYRDHLKDIRRWQAGQ